ASKPALLERYKNPEVLKQLQQLQLVDYITGQTDRHADNIHITRDDKILGIDHDFSFSGSMLGRAPNMPLPGNKNKGLPAYIDSQTKAKILGLDTKEFVSKIRPYLSTQECDCTEKRLDAVK